MTQLGNSWEYVAETTQVSVIQPVASNNCINNELPEVEGIQETNKTRQAGW